jgi:hypothetical protein
MKLRIKGNSLRLRLTQSEVEEFENNGQIMDSIDFGLRKLTYGIKAHKGSIVHATYKKKAIIVKIPHQKIYDWVSTDQVGIEGHLLLEEGEYLSILIEKDFQCLHRENEDKTDLYPNPNL